MNQDEKLIEEYKITSETVRHLERIIWGSAGLLGFGNIGSLYLKVDSPTKNIFIGVLLIVFTWVWWGIAKRWWDIQHTYLLRIRHIESLLNLYSHRYVGYRDEISKSKSELEKGLNSDFLLELQDKPSGFEKRGVQRWMRLTPWTITIIWISSISYNFWILKGQLDMEKVMSLNLISLIVGVVGLLGIGFCLGFILGISKRWEWAKKENDNSKKPEVAQNTGPTGS
jgi:hypothetical protein